MNFPGVHELGTITKSATQLLWQGDAEAAAETWNKYSEESVLGSGVRAAYHGITGDTEEATRIAKGMGRATGRALTGGGILNAVPVFKELDNTGKALGDLLGGSDVERAKKRWSTRDGNCC